MTPLLLAAALALPAAAAPLTRGPYLVDATSVSARICWRAGPGPEGDACSTWDNLEPGEDFNYSLKGVPGSWKARTLPPGPKRLRFAVLGGAGDGGERQARVAAALARWSPDLVLLAGDVVLPAGEPKRYDKRYFAPYAALIAGRPFFPAVGAADYGFSRAADKADRRFREGYEAVFRRPPYYSFDAAGAHVAVLDSVRDCTGAWAGEPLGEGSAQRAWLERDLKASRARWKFVLGYAPPYSSARGGGCRALADGLAPLSQRAGVDAVFSGRDRHYERVAPPDAPVYFVVGTGGAPPRKPRRSTSAKVAAAAGFLAVTLEPAEAIFEFYDEAGRLLDSSRILKRP